MCMSLSRSVYRRVQSTIACLVLAVLLLGSRMPAIAQPAAPKLKLKPEALLQIRALQHEKKSRTRGQKKMDSQLVYAAKMQRGLMPRGIGRLRAGARLAANGSPMVDIDAKVSPAVISK